MATKKPYIENPEKDQDRVYDTFDHYKRWGFVLFPENKNIYQYIEENKQEGTVLTAGCGAGIGAYIVDADMATDKLDKNVRFAKELYPKILFETWDISAHAFRKYDVVVCVEAIEHIKNYRQGVKNLIASANKEVWISTPTVDNPESPPTNPYHVREFTKEEFIELIGDYEVEIPLKGLFRIKL